MKCPYTHILTTKARAHGTDEPEGVYLKILSWEVYQTTPGWICEVEPSEYSTLSKSPRGFKWSFTVDHETQDYPQRHGYTGVTLVDEEARDPETGEGESPSHTH